MKITYSVLYILLIIALSGCTVIAKRSSRPSRHAVAWLETSLIIPTLANLIIILYDDRLLETIGHYIYFLGINGVILSLVNFTNSYCRGIGDGDGSKKPTVMYVMLAADSFQLLLNPIFGHAFSLKAVESDGVTSYKLMVYAGQTAHRVIDYIILGCVIAIFVLAAVKTPKIYRERYTVLLGCMIGTAAMQAYYVFTGSNYDRPVLGYGFFGMVIFYFAIWYRPLRLLDQMLSSIISDLSDAFYVFDPNGKCIWANEQGCRIVGFSGTNYEEVNNKLKEIFGSPDANTGQNSKRVVGEGENVRFYSLDEKQVKGPNGKNNGSYLRIQDVTEEERELKALDEQIGQISQEAYKDSLTGVGNKTAYNNKVIEINQQIEKGFTDFAVVMVDMNNLKRINDEYGHRSGDLYIKGCCYLICEAFKHSPVFRIGGDEFVAILRGQDFAARLENVQDLRNAFDDAYEQTEADPWLRYSASVGMAEYASDDSSFELVFKRADKAMYEDKKLFKALHGSYR